MAGPAAEKGVEGNQELVVQLAVPGNMHTVAAVEAQGMGRKGSREPGDRAEADARRLGRHLDDQVHNSQVAQDVGPAGSVEDLEEGRTLGGDSADNPAHGRCRWTWF